MPVHAHAQASESGAPVGEQLRAWRLSRNLSQLELALEADVSARHVSFLETGRAQPSRAMIVRLAEQLEIPLRDRNRLLLAAGYAPLYAETPLDSEPMGPVRQAIDRFLRSHEPYPAILIDECHTLITANDAAGVITEGVAPELLEPPANALRIALHPAGMAPRVANFTEWSAQLMYRLRRETRASGRRELAELYDELAAYPGVITQVADASAGEEIVLPLRLRSGDRELAFFSTLSTFGMASDITVAGLAIEAFYPADAVTANALLGTL